MADLFSAGSRIPQQQKKRMVLYYPLYCIYLWYVPYGIISNLFYSRCEQRRVVT